MLDITNNNSAASGQTITNNNSVRLHLLPVPAVRLLHFIESHLAAQPQALQDFQAFTCCPVSAPTLVHWHPAQFLMGHVM